MRYLVISDIHGNWAALEAARTLIASEKPNGILFLGDYITDGSDPQRVLRNLHEISREYPCVFILGNREEYFLKNRLSPDPTWQPCSHTGSLWYTAKHLTASDLDWFAEMPVSQTIHTPDGPDFMICHGSPVSAFDSLLGSRNRTRREEILQNIEPDLLICGHTHRQEIYEIGNKRIIFCPSLGMPLMRNGKIPAQHLLRLELSDGGWTHSFLSVLYDMEQYIRALTTDPFADAAKIWCRGIVRTLRTQNNYIADCLALVYKLAAEDGYTGSAPLPEIYWEAAAKELSI